MNSNPYEAPQAQVPIPATLLRKKLGRLENANRVAWGATSCFWGFLVLLVLVTGSRLMMAFAANDSLWFFYSQTSYWGGWLETGLQFAGLFLLCFIGEQTGSKTFFKLAFGCLVANIAWELLPLVESEPMEIPAAVEFFAQVVSLCVHLFIYLALRRISQFTQDRQMLRWSAWALGLYAVIFFLNTGIQSLYYFTEVHITDLRFGWGEHNIPYGYWLSSAHIFLGLPLLYLYPRLMKRMASWWEQVPVAELASHDSSISTGAIHEPESV